MKKARKVQIERKTKETKIRLRLNLDGQGEAKINTTIPFLDHMLELLVKHSRFDLEIKASGDTQIDYHHLIEDIGLALGGTINKGLGDKQGINRYGSTLLPMDETLVQVVVDLSGRPFLHYDGPKRGRLGEDLPVALIREFLRALVMEAKITLHINVLYGEEIHHKIEAIFKGMGVVLAQAVAINPKIKGVPSTKGVL